MLFIDSVHLSILVSKLKKHTNSKFILFDIPEVAAISSAFLISSFPDKKIRLYGEGSISHANKDFERLMSLAHHIHISGAEGLDGEGTSFNSKNLVANNILTKCLDTNHIKVVETWQGHLDNFSGFHQSIYDLVSIKK